uniref:F-box domain-containing protein n=1 Tax=Steinernema glaseri TaxID=37863 RepID=A0A1I8AJZ0_9BILA
MSYEFEFIGLIPGMARSWRLKAETCKFMAYHKGGRRRGKRYRRIALHSHQLRPTRSTMNATPLDFVERVVNLLSYDDYYKRYNDKSCRERRASAITRLSRPWSQVVTSLKECRVYVCGDVYSIHEMVIEERELYRIEKCHFEVDLLTWNSRKRVVRELSFSGRKPCKCYPTCERRLSEDVFRRLRNILRRNQRPIFLQYFFETRPTRSKFKENLGHLLNAIHGVGLLSVPCMPENYLSRLLERPVNFFNMKRLVQRETNFIVNHVIDAMKKGLRGWESSQSERRTLP